MLVLSRRESEKVLFPSLGITVEVSRIKGNTVRLGIDAPREFRVIRAELDDDREHQIVNPEEFRAPVDSTNGYAKGLPYGQPANSRDLGREREIQRNLDAVSLTVQLAQNQLRQGLGTHAEEALEQAMESLRELESTLTESNVDSPMNPVSVREKPVGYEIGPGHSNSTALPSEALVQRNQEVRELIAFLGQEFFDWSDANVG